MSAQPSPDLIFVKTLTAAQIKRRAAYARLMGSLPVTPNTKILHDMPTKQKPVFGVFASV
jgi:hypothetical protein